LGGYMAVQFEVAYSASVKGAGVVAGGPYDCARDGVTTATTVCSCTSLLGCMGSADTHVPQLINTTDQEARDGLIDPTSNLQNQRVWMFSGKIDSVVPQRVMNDLLSYYKHYIPAPSIFYKSDLPAQHAMPTDFFGNPCQMLGDPYINNCNFDAAGELLQWLYGTLHPRNRGQLSGSLTRFDQSEFIDNPASHDLDTTGWVYVPSACASGQACKLHVVFHGCKQYQSYLYFSLGQGLVTFGTTYVRNAGYNEWADANGIIILYPQATADFSRNLNGCWDWWGYDDPNYATKKGAQMAAVKAMIDRISNGSTRPSTGPDSRRSND
jgi:poly(3-hydroxybutyrate) depolymerase